MHLKKLAVYTPSSPAKTKRDLTTAHAHRHNQLHEVKKVKKVLPKREKQPDMVVATIYGKVVSWENNYFRPSATQTPNAPVPSPVMVTATIDGKVVSWVNNWYPDAVIATPATSPPEAPGLSAPTEKTSLFHFSRYHISMTLLTSIRSSPSTRRCFRATSRLWSQVNCRTICCRPSYCGTWNI